MSMAALLTEYGPMKRCVATPAIDEMATIEPPPDRAMAAPACLNDRNVPVRLVVRMPFHSSSEVVSNGPSPPPPAAATHRCRPSPPVATAVATAARTSSSLVTSHTAKPTSAPAAAPGASSSTDWRSRSSRRPAR